MMYTKKPVNDSEHHLPYYYYYEYCQMNHICQFFKVELIR